MGSRSTFEFTSRVNLSSPNLYCTARTLGFIKQTLNRTSRCNKVDAVRLYASYKLNLLLLKGQRCVKDPLDKFYRNIILQLHLHIDICLNKLLQHRNKLLLQWLSFFWALKGVFAKNKRGYWLRSKNIWWWLLLILFLSILPIRRKLLKRSLHILHTNSESCNI